MINDRPLKWSVLTLLGLLVGWPNGVDAGTLVKFGDLKGDVSDGRHEGWTYAISWSPAMPTAQSCTDGWLHCLDSNGHRIKLQFHPNDMSRDLVSGINQGTRFEEVRIEDYQGEIVGSDFTASTLKLSGVQITNISVTGKGADAVEAVSLVYDRLSHDQTWDESDIMGVAAPKTR
jgi:type VI protein secretion system component Hcp